MRIKTSGSSTLKGLLLGGSSSKQSWECSADRTRKGTRFVRDWRRPVAGGYRPHFSVRSCAGIRYSRQGQDSDADFLVLVRSARRYCAQSPDCDQGEGLPCSIASLCR